MLLFKLVASLGLTWIVAVSAVPVYDELSSSGGDGGDITPEMIQNWRERKQLNADETFEACMDRQLAEIEQIDAEIESLQPSKRPPGWKRWFYRSERFNIRRWIINCKKEAYDAHLQSPGLENGNPVIDRLRKLKQERLAEADTMARAIARAKASAIAEARARDAKARGRRIWIPQPYQQAEAKGGGQSNSFSDLKANIKALEMNMMQAIGRVQTQGSNSPSAGFSATGLPFEGVPGRFGFAP